MDKQKRGRGRPKTRPEGLVGLRCEVSPDEAELVRKACDVRQLAQWEFCRAAVVESARKVLKPPPKARKPRRKP